MSLSIRLFGNRDRAQELVVEAKRRMALLKQFMGFQNLKQLEPQPIRMSDGSTIRVKSIFGIDIVEIVGVRAVPVIVSEEVVGGVDILFLITKGGWYCGWEIKDNGARLTPKTFNFDYIVELDPEPILIYPSTVKSSSDMSLHVYAIQDNGRGAVPYAASNYLNYGQYTAVCRISGVWYYAYNGIRSCWQPPGWTPGEESFNNEWYNPDGDYVCGARRSYQLDNDDNVIKNLEFFETGAGVGRIEYDTKDGHQIGTSFNYSNRSHIHAVLSPTLVIGVDDSTYALVEINTLNWELEIECIGTSAYGWYSGEYYRADEYEYKFGNVVIEKHLGSYSNRYSTLKSRDCPPPDCGPFPWHYIHKYAFYSSSAQMSILDYDHKDGDSTFICFYRKKSSVGADTDADYKADEDYWNGHRLAPQTWADVADYKMVYRLNNGALHTEILATLKDGTYYWYGSGPSTPGEGAYRCWYLAGDLTIVDGLQGDRVSDISCQVTDDYIFYSYAIQTFTGDPATGNMDDCQDDNWTFKHRILGVIHIATGKKTEHTVNNVLLGNYASGYDKDARYAVGLHKG